MSMVAGGMRVFEAFDEMVARAPERVALVWIDEDGRQESITAAALHGDAMARAHALRCSGIAADDLVLIAMPYSRELVVTFLGAAYGAAVPAILPYISAKVDVAGQIDRVSRRALDAGACAVLCLPPLSAHLAAALPKGCQVIDVSRVSTDGDPETWHMPAIVRPESLAFIQFTSGTTGVQKGIGVSHAAVLNFLDEFARVLQVSPNDVNVSWLPYYHDMGLITGMLLPLLKGFLAVQMSPAYWVRAPIVMLRAIDEFRGTLSWMPNFAFNHIARSVRDADLAALDLGSWRMCGNSAEPVRQDSLAAFSTRLVGCGFRPSALRSAYGMAETVLTVAISSAKPRVDWVSAYDLQHNRRAIAAAADRPGAISFVSVGSPFPSCDWQVVDEELQALPERCVGEVLVRSPQMFAGYHGRPDLTAEVLRDGAFRSGDLGYIADGELYICGRKKDVIIVGGANIYPEDVEAIANRTAGIQPGRAVAFGVADAELGTERIVLLCELREAVAEEVKEIERMLRRRVLAELDTTLGLVRFVERGWITKTTSGKLARSTNRDRYLQELAPGAGAVRPVYGRP